MTSEKSQKEGTMPAGGNTYERNELTVTRFKISTTQNRINRLNKQLEDTYRCLRELDAKEAELAREHAVAN